MTTEQEIEKAIAVLTDFEKDSKTILMHKQRNDKVLLTTGWYSVHDLRNILELLMLNDLVKQGKEQ